MNRPLLVAIALIIAGLAFAGGSLLAKPATVETMPALTYGNPVHVVAPATADQGGAITIEQDRCVNVDHDLPVEITVFWQSADGLRLIPFISPTTGLPLGRVLGVLQSGCRSAYRSTLPIPSDLPLGSWRLLGQLCYGGVDEDIPTTCTGWHTDVFEVTDRPVQ